MTGSAFRKPRLAGGDQTCNQNELSPYREAPPRGFNSIFKFAFIAGLAFLVAAEVAYGQAQNYGTNDPGIRQRMKNQQQRIVQGIDSGELTLKEAGRLEAREAKIRRDEAQMKADGQLTAKERQRLDKELDKASERIYKQKHDRRHVKTY